MDYKTTYHHYFKKTQNRLSNLLQSQLAKYLEEGRPFEYVDPKVIEVYQNKFDQLKLKWNYDEIKPIINLIGLRYKTHTTHSLSKILSNEVKDEFDNLKKNINYKFFIAQLAQLEAVEKGFYNYLNNQAYFERCYKTNGIDKINFNEIKDGYNNLDDFHELGKILKMDDDIGISIPIRHETKSNKNDGLKSLLTEDEKVLLIQTIYELKTPLHKFLKPPEFYRLLFITSDLFDNRIVEKKLSNLAIYRKLGKNVDNSKKTEIKKIETLILKLENLKVKSIIPELRKKLSKTI